VTYTEGWEVFGVLPRPEAWSEPTSRRMGTPIEWPEAEVTGGINHVKVELSAYGDDGGSSVFVHVWGTDRERVEAAWKRATLLVSKDLFNIVIEGEG
jgi:hypothetical protein